ncbi:MAG: glucose-1-phosphate adenylyltransferase subunit GlgD [Clostridia bacterium]|nr:glucose-1-phosphate adenylyltransferase subunit GlgD [Clostridia bacterium]
MTEGIIFSNLHDDAIPELTRVRTMASLPFACRYRLIDFPLSNLVNSGVNSVYVVTTRNYQSLLDHVGSGKDWDLARRSGGLKMMTPYMSAFAGTGIARFNSRMEALKSISNTIFNMTSDYVVLADCDGICNVNISDMVAQHERTGADITVAVKKMNVTPEKAARSILVDSNEDGRITDVLIRPSRITGEHDVNINIWVVSRRYLQVMVHDAMARNLTSMSRDFLARNAAFAKYMVYRYDGYYASFSSMQDYFACSMNLLENSEERNSIFGVKNRPIITKVRNSTPTKYSDDAKVKNSLIADGCVIEGTVENSILFRGVKVGKNTVVKNSILFQDTYTGNSVNLNCVVADKNVVIRDYRTLSGYETMPFCIEKGKMI